MIMTEYRISYFKASSLERRLSVAELIRKGKTLKPEKYIVRAEYVPFYTDDPKHELFDRAKKHAFNSNSRAIQRDIFKFSEESKAATWWYMDGNNPVELKGFNIGGEGHEQNRKN